MWISKKKYEELNNKISSLEKYIDRVQKENWDDRKYFNKEFEKLHRIIEKSSSEPTFVFDRKRYTGIITSSSLKLEHNNKLFIYSNKKEYVFELEELKQEEIDETSYEFNVDRNIAYFNVSSRYGYTYWTKHEFIIDLENNKYIHNSKPDEERNSKEKEKNAW